MHALLTFEELRSQVAHVDVKSSARQLLEILRHASIQGALAELKDCKAVELGWNRHKCPALRTW